MKFIFVFVAPSGIRRRNLYFSFLSSVTVQVKEALASEQTRIRTLDHSLTQLSSSVKMGLAEVSGLKESDRKLVANMQHLSGSFDSLLKDASRHSDVLEQLIGEEVMEFLEWPVQDQEAHSIPGLKEQLGNVQEQLRRHNLSITSLLGNSPGENQQISLSVLIQSSRTSNSKITRLH